MVPVSAKSGENIGQLMEAIQLQAELLQLTADVRQPAQAVVLDGYIRKALGPS